MKSFVQLSVLALVLGIGFAISSCGSDSDCGDINEWVGIYSRQSDEVCSTDSTYTFVAEIKLEASPVAETFEYEGEPFMILNCTATDGFFTMIKDGDKLTVELIGTGCSWVFKKQ